MAQSLLFSTVMERTQSTFTSFSRVLFLVAGGFATLACAPQFKLIEPLEKESSHYLDVQAKQGTLSSKQGNISWQEKSDADKNLRLSFEMKIPFSKVYSAGSHLVRNLAPYTCQVISGIDKDAPGNYAKGETPCGHIIDENWKSLLIVPVEGYSGEKSGFQVQVSGTQIPVWLSRRQASGLYQEDSLDDLKSVTRSSSQDFGEDISLRYRPDGNAMQMEICLNIPGGQVKGTSQSIHASASRRVLGVKLGYSSDFEVTPGHATYEYGRACFAAGLDRSSQVLSLSTTQAPYLNAVSYAGLNIRIKDWFLNLVDEIMRFFRSSIKDRVIAHQTTQLNNLADSDIESGRWFAKVHGEALLERLGRKYSEQMQTLLRRTGIPITDSDVTRILKDQCRIKKISMSSDWSDRLERFCQDVINKIEIKTEIFAADADSKSKGCYEHFARLHDASDAPSKWWNNQCFMSAHFSVTLPSVWQDYANEVKTLLAGFTLEDLIPADWQSRADQLGIDPLSLLLLLEKLESQGVRQISNSDWQGQISDHLEQIRQELGQ